MSSSTDRPPLTAESSFYRRFDAYLVERFPLGPYAVLVAALVAAIVASAAAGRGPVRLSLCEPAAFFVLLFFFFHLRVLDEHKDAADDRLAHPDRILSRGILTLPDLAVVGMVFGAIQLLLVLWLGGAAAVWWGAAMVYSLLMRVEFFAPEFLRRHVLLYAVTHNPVVLLLVLFVDAVYRAGGSWLDPRALAFGALATFTTLGFEVGRKLRAPEDEREGQDTYTRALGVGPAAALMATLAVLAAGAAVAVGLVLSTSLVFLVLGPLVCVLPALTALPFAREPTAKRAKVVDAAASVGALLVYVALAVDVFARQGAIAVWK